MAAIARATPIGVAALCALAGIIAGEARAGETTHPDGLVQSTTVEREDGFVELYQSVRKADGSVTPAQNRMLMRLPQGSRVRFSRFERCHLAKLQARGPNGCPRRSKVGHGRVSGSYLGDQVHGTLPALQRRTTWAPPHPARLRGARARSHLRVRGEVVRTQARPSAGVALAVSGGSGAVELRVRLPLPVPGHAVRGHMDRDRVLHHRRNGRRPQAQRRLSLSLTPPGPQSLPACG